MTQEDSVYANLSKEDREFIDSYPSMPRDQQYRARMTAEEYRDKWIIVDPLGGEAFFMDIGLAVSLFHAVDSEKAFYLNKKGHRTDVTELFKNY